MNDDNDTFTDGASGMKGGGRSGDRQTAKPTSRRACPICKAPASHDYRPFCSRRCADVDLSRWLSGRYAIAGGDADEDEDGDQSRAEETIARIRGGPQGSEA